MRVGVAVLVLMVGACSAGTEAVPALAEDHPLGAELELGGYYAGSVTLPVAGGGMVGDKRELVFRTDDGGKLFLRGDWDDEAGAYAEPPTVSIEIPDSLAEPSLPIRRFDADEECTVDFVPSPAPDATPDELAGILRCGGAEGAHRVVLDATATFRWRPEP